MSKHLGVALVVALCALPLLGQNVQIPPASVDSNSKSTATTATSADYSKEALVEEEDRTKIDFENDGTYTRTSSGRVRIQSEAGLQHFSTLKFPYQSAAESIDVDYVRVVKPDGATISTTSEAIQDMPADITRQAPFYSDLREKHIAVKGLSVGDVLEMMVHWHLTKPLVPGQFWYSFNFLKDFIVLHQEIQVTIPRDRVIKWKSAEVQPVISEQGSRKIYTWTHSVLERKSADEQKKQQELQTYKLARGKLPPPDVQLSTFQSWDEIGAWYAKLQSDRVKPSADVRAKAAELTKGAKDDDARLRAIYGYVSTQIHYIGIAFGIGRYQPHAASEVLANQYGDCKDKHTLLASLLEAVGIKAYPALINATHALDPDVPSPSQFDHIITAVPQGAGSVWLDTTVEVAPYGYLLSLLWDKQALLIPGDRAAVLVSTPAEPSVRATETFRMDAKLKDNGTLEGKVVRSVSGSDSEVVLRSVFRRTPMEQWKQVVQQISYASGFAGDVSDVTASLPDKTDEAFKFTYTYSRKDYPQWSDKRISSPLPPMTGIIPDEEPSHPIPLSVGEFRYESRVEVPTGYTPRLPARIDLAEKFAEYHAAYTVEAGALKTDRTLVLKVRELAANQHNELKKFFSAVSDDHDGYVSFRQDHITPDSYQEAIWSLPDSNNTEAEKAYEDARGQNNRNSAAKIESLRRAVQVDPKFTRAWLWLGELYTYQRQNESAIDALRSAIANDPQETLSYKGLGFALMKLRRPDEAVSAWRRMMAIAPDDPDGPENLGSALLAAKHYTDAASTFESAIRLSPDDVSLYVQLGTAYLKADNEDKALAAYKKALEIDSKPVIYNDIGYYLADANKQLPLALQYAEKAVRDEEEASAKVDFLQLKDLWISSSLAAYWDTLGWVYFRMGNYDRAESYVRSAWEIRQDGVTADHLGQVYEKKQKLAMAVHMYNLALEVNPGLEGTPERMRHLAHVSLPKNRMSAREELSQMRTIKIPLITKEDVNAYFDVLIVAGKIESAHFLSGSDGLSGAATAVEKSAFQESFPPNSTAHVFRRGVLTCSEIGCSFVFYPLS